MSKFGAIIFKCYGACSRTSKDWNFPSFLLFHWDKILTNQSIPMQTKNSSPKNLPKKPSPKIIWKKFLPKNSSKKILRNFPKILYQFQTIIIGQTHFLNFGHFCWKIKRKNNFSPMVSAKWLGFWKKVHVFVAEKIIEPAPTFETFQKEIIE